jgi:hypothetical protein
VLGVSVELAEELAALTVPVELAGQAEARPRHAESVAPEGELVVYRLVLFAKARFRRYCNHQRGTDQNGCLHNLDLAKNLHASI